MISLPKSVGTIGGGNMAEAILQGLLQAGSGRQVVSKTTQVWRVARSPPAAPCVVGRLVA